MPKKYFFYAKNDSKQEPISSVYHFQDYKQQNNLLIENN
jgi:hypothetical protein